MVIKVLEKVDGSGKVIDHTAVGSVPLLYRMVSGDATEKVGLRPEFHENQSDGEYLCKCFSDKFRSPRLGTG